MKLGIETLRKITRGAVRVEERDGYLYLLRFTKAQEDYYQKERPDFYKKTFCMSGIKLDFVTDSKNLIMKGVFMRAISRSYYSIEIFVDGKQRAVIDNYSNTQLQENYPDQSFEVKDLDACVELGEGKKRVTVYLPWSMAVKFSEISIDDGASVEPCEALKKVLAYGDSITQGHDTLRSHTHYAQMLCEALGYELVNRGIGAEIYRPGLVSEADDFVPEFITVAYGTNDWYTITKEEFTSNCENFLKNLRSNYKDTKIFVISPIWRANIEEERPFGSFYDVEKIQREIASGIDNVSVISGLDLVPHSPDFFGDLSLHPSAKGFEHYFENLLKAIKKEL